MLVAGSGCSPASDGGEETLSFTQDVINGDEFGPGGLYPPSTRKNPFNVVRIVSKWGNEESWGSGVLLNERWILTAAHVIKNGANDYPDEILVSLEGDNGIEMQYADGRAAHPSYRYPLPTESMGPGIDVALVRVPVAFSSSLVATPLVRLDYSPAFPLQGIVIGYGPYETSLLNDGLRFAEWAANAANLEDSPADALAKLNHPTWPGYPKTYYVEPYATNASTFVHIWRGDSGGPVLLDVDVNGNLDPRLVAVTSGMTVAGGFPQDDSYKTPDHTLYEGVEGFRDWVTYTVDGVIPSRRYNFDRHIPDFLMPDDILVDCNAVDGLHVLVVRGEGGQSWRSKVPPVPAGVTPFPPCPGKKFGARAGNLTGDTVAGGPLVDVSIAVDNTLYALRGKVDSSDPVMGRSFDVTSNVTLVSSDLQEMETVDINSTSVNELLIGFGNGSQQVFNVSSTGTLTEDKRAKHVTLADFDGDGELDTSYVRLNAVGETGLYIDYVYGGGASKALNNDTASNLSATLGTVSTYLGNFNGDIGSEGRPLMDYVMAFDGKLSVCRAKDVGVPECSASGSLYSNATLPATSAKVRDANNDGYDDFEVRLQDGSARVFWGKSTGLTAANFSPTTVVTNGDSLGTQKTGSGVLVAPDWVLVDGVQVDGPRTKPEFVSVSWDDGATTQTRTALAVYPSGDGVSLIRLTSAFTGATTNALPTGAVQTWAQGILSSCSAQVIGDEFCSAACPCAHGGPDCDSDAECSTGNLCIDSNGPGFGYGPDWDICVATECASLTPGNGTYCSAACPCGLGGGDCDSDGTDVQCQEGLVCDTNVGPAFKMGPDTDVCVPTACASVTMGTATYCTPGCPCGHGGGDCDATADCMPGLVCGMDFGPAFKLSAASDVCVPSACAAVGLNTGTFCTPECPCGHGGGDCDADADCLPGLVCGTDLGPAFAMGATYDVCVPSACESRTLYSSTFCTAGCRCGHGGGNCDSDAECMPGLKCGTNNGATFGRPATADICYRP
jgi:hypothetical protein